MVHHHVPCGACFYCARKRVRAVRALQEERDDRRLRAIGRRLRRVRARRSTGSSSAGRSRSRTACSPRRRPSSSPSTPASRPCEKAGDRRGRDGAGRRPGADRPAADAARALARARRSWRPTRCPSGGRSAVARAPTCVLDARGGRAGARCAALTEGRGADCTLVAAVGARPHSRRRSPPRARPAASCLRRDLARRDGRGRPRPADDGREGHPDGLQLVDRRAGSRRRSSCSPARCACGSSCRTVSRWSGRRRRSRWRCGPAPGHAQGRPADGGGTAVERPDEGRRPLRPRGRARSSASRCRRPSRRRGPAAHAGRAHLRHGRQGVPPRLPRADDPAARRVRPRGRRASSRRSAPGSRASRPGRAVVVANSAPCGACPLLPGRQGRACATTCCSGTAPTPSSRASPRAWSSAEPAAAAARRRLPPGGAWSSRSPASCAASRSAASRRGRRSR